MISEEHPRILRIREALQALAPIQLTITDNSHQHAGHNEAAASGGTHIKLSIISAGFSGKSRVSRHRSVQDLLQAEFATGLHALQIEAKAPGE